MAGLRRLLGVSALVIALAGVSPALAAEETPFSASELVAQRERLNDRRVVVQGEAIGEALRADTDHVWVNVRSGGTDVGLYVSRTAAEGINTYGDYDHTGDDVLADGVFHLACPQHAGALDVHVEDLSVREQGAPTPHEVEWGFGVAGVALGVAGVAIAYAGRRRREAPYTG